MSSSAPIREGPVCGRTYPNIPFNPSITPITPYGDPDLCYDSCHLLNSEHKFESNSDANSEDNKFKEERQDCKSNSELLHKATNTSTTVATTVT
ncbi:unnamed protein product [Oppiella nova]|uniref:Uncharacterized protein n=1 Tax=Oppiella nova TaxID=334625 RepID=A0A7R9MRQ5_9ACAR|nr:unnamed protein product [Oppiella nova]CAG2181159.1 unnamed protein product [Oppiella nova]